MVYVNLKKATKILGSDLAKKAKRSLYHSLIPTNYKKI